MSRVCVTVQQKTELIRNCYVSAGSFPIMIDEVLQN